MNLTEYKEEFEKLVAKYQSDDQAVPLGRKGWMVGTMEKAFGSELSRLIFIGALTGKNTSKALTDPEWKALSEWLGVSDVTGTWALDPGRVLEAKKLINTMMTMY